MYIYIYNPVMKGSIGTRVTLLKNAVDERNYRSEPGTKKADTIILLAQNDVYNTGSCCDLEK